MKKAEKLQRMHTESKVAITETNRKIDELGHHSEDLFHSLTEIQNLFDAIRNIPSEKRIQYEEYKVIRLNWFSQVEIIENEYNKTTVKNAGLGAAGAGAGVAVASLGPSAAMGVATSFGVASTGTAISSLSGAAATNAALAWLGGGALAAGGGGMAAGNLLLVLAGPIGIAIAGVALLSGGLLFWKAKSEKARLENIFMLVSKRDINKYKLAIVELDERIKRIDGENHLLQNAIKQIKEYGTDYALMNEAQQYELGSYVNLMEASTQLLVNPILGLQPDYNSDDYDEYVDFRHIEHEKSVKLKNPIIALSNFLYKIDIDEKDKTLLWNYMKANVDLISSVNANNFEVSIIDMVQDALVHKYKLIDPDGGEQTEQWQYTPHYSSNESSSDNDNEKNGETH